MRSRDDLRRLTRSWNRFDRVDLETARLDADERARWEERLFSAYAECGCDAGGLAVLVAIVGLVVFALVSPGGRTWTSVGLGVAAIVGAALAGKLAGIAFARILLRRDIRRVRPYLPA